MTDDTRCPGCNLPIDSGTHTFGCPHLGSDSIPVMISPGWALTRDEIAATVEENRDLRAILTDLIAELVGDDGDGHELTGDDKHGCQVCAAIDRAEARLRKATGDE